MTTYEKLTVDRFEQALTEGKYETLTGARRAIGKVGGWSGKDKERAQALALKHFGVPGPSAPKEKKSAGKKGPAKKAAAKPAVAKKAAAKPAIAAASKPGPKKGVKRTPAVSAARTVSREPIASGSPVVEPNSTHEAITMGTEIIGFAGQLREQVKLTKEMSPGTDLTPVITEVNGLLLKAGRMVSNHVQGNGPAQEVPPARLAVSTPVEVGGAHAAVTPAETNGLTADEALRANALKNATPASSIGALPRPLSAQS